MNNHDIGKEINIIDQDKYRTAISAIIPVYNTPPNALDRMLKSIKNQIGDIPYEVIIIDDGSKEDCAKYLDEISDSTIKVYHIPNGGVSNARNTGIKMAQGEYITFIDADDYIDEHFFMQAFDVAKKYKADVVYGNIEYIPTVFNKRPQNMDRVYVRTKKDFDDIRASFLGYIDGNLHYSIFDGPVGKLYKTAIAKQIQFKTDLRYVEDQIYNNDFLDLCTVVVSTPYTWYYYIQDNNSATHKTYKGNFFKDNANVMDALCVQDQKQSQYIRCLARIDAMDKYGLFVVVGYIRNKKHWRVTRQHMIEGMNHQYIQDAISNMKGSWQYMNYRDKLQYYLFRYKMYLFIYLGLRYLYRD